ncbi:unnamed protein product [Calypogeia fissa]
MTTTTTTSLSQPDALTNLLTLLPSGTYLAFSTIVPIMTNNGDCSEAEEIITGVFLFLFTFLCAFSSFTDSYSAPNGSVYYGVVTTTGLWNPFFANSTLTPVSGWTYTGGGTTYHLKLSDFYVSTLAVISFLSLTLLSSDLATCYYPDIDETALKAIPLPVNLFVGIFLAFAPSSRHGIGFAFASKSGTTSTSSSTPSTSTTSTSKTATKAASTSSTAPLLQSSAGSSISAV